MLSFIGQFNTQNGPNGANQYRLSLDIDETHKDGFVPIMKYTKGDTFLVLMIPIDDEFRTIGEAINESDSETKLRLNKQMHALIKEIATTQSLTVTEVRTSLKDMLKKKGYLNSSTAELDVRGFAAAIYILQNEF
jgi:hypothetical protein